MASVNGGSSVSSDASSTSTDVFPSLTNGVLQQLRLDAAASARLVSNSDKVLRNIDNGSSLGGEAAGTCC